ncbi:hypothetical protein PSA99_002917 [Escherichia coli]|nr:hypothetical protein [Escherichia coli]EMA0828031.1 hypothetical protein [Escherichia coli O157]EKL5716006.1 hypothetical protein [Escherichia coli]EKL5793557.1 hypothetical protein [Escherichia coli]EMA0833254.1 hypothetical protein [Escherichia coli]
MLLINWEDLYGDKDPVAFVDRRWRYTEEQLAAKNLTAKRRKIIQCKYKYAQFAAKVSPQIESFVLKLYDEYLKFKLDFVQVYRAQIRPDTNICRWKVVCDGKDLPLSLTIEWRYGYHECGLYDIWDVIVDPAKYLNTEELEYINKVILDMFFSYTRENSEKERDNFLDTISNHL